jgi:hypothetical protein
METNTHRLRCRHCVSAPGGARCGGGRGATARKIAERVHRMLKYGQEYVRQSKETYEQAYQQRLKKIVGEGSGQPGLHAGAGNDDAVSARRARRPPPTKRLCCL